MEHNINVESVDYCTQGERPWFASHVNGLLTVKDGHWRNYLLCSKAEISKFTSICKVNSVYFAYNHILIIQFSL